MYSFKPLSLEHCNSQYLGWLSDPDVNEFLDISPSLTIPDLKEYVLSGLCVDSNRLNFAVYALNTYIGNASLYVSGDTPDGCFHFGWFVGDKSYWGRHTSTSIMYYLFDIGFSYFDFEFCIGGVFASNLKARLANIYVGFKETGQYNYFSTKANRVIPAISLSISSTQWFQRRSELNELKPDIFCSLTLNQSLVDFIYSHPLFIRLHK